MFHGAEWTRSARVTETPWFEASPSTFLHPTAGEGQGRGHGLPSRLRWYDGRCTSDSCRLAASPKSAALGQERKVDTDSLKDSVCAGPGARYARAVDRCRGHCAEETGLPRATGRHGFQGLRAHNVTHDLRVLRAVSRVSNDLATSRADARKRSTTGLSVRFFSVAMTTGHG